MFLIGTMDCNSMNTNDVCPMEDSANEVQGFEYPSNDCVPIFVEVCIKPNSDASPELIQSAVEILLSRLVNYVEGEINFHEANNHILESNVRSIVIVDVGEEAKKRECLLFWQVSFQIHMFKLHEEGVCEEMEEGEDIATFHEWLLPCKEFHGLWESLIFGDGIKQRLLKYSESALLFSQKGVDSNLIAWNKVLLLFGPPGTGKTSICKALAQKLAIRLYSKYKRFEFVEVNSHSLFSKWFSESGKLVTKLFQKIQELLEESNTLVFILIDEVESLSASRQAALHGSEPSDSIRVVNALLTQLDHLKHHPNVLVFTTSNITQAIDTAFVDRADLKIFIPPPPLQARYAMLRSSFIELQAKGIIIASRGKDNVSSSPSNSSSPVSSPSNSHSSSSPSFSIPPSLAAFDALNLKSKRREIGSEKKENDDGFFDFGLGLSQKLLQIAKKSEGLSGRTLRKLPFLAHATCAQDDKISAMGFMDALYSVVLAELADRADMSLHQTPNSG